MKSEERIWCKAPGVIYGAYRYRHETADGETSDVRLEWAALPPEPLFTLLSSLFSVFTGRVTRRQTVRLQTSDPDRRRAPALSDSGVSRQMESDF